MKKLSKNEKLTINRFLEKLDQDRSECKQAKDYISRFGFVEVEKYLEGRQDCLSGLIERYFIHPKIKPWI